MSIVTVRLQGKEVQADLLNPTTVKRFEEGFDTVLKKFNEATKFETGSDGIAYQCQATIDYVEDIFGKSGARDVFGEKTDLLTCLDVLFEMQGMYETQVNPIIKEKTAQLKKKMETTCHEE